MKAVAEYKLDVEQSMNVISETEENCGRRSHNVFISFLLQGY